MEKLKFGLLSIVVLSLLGILGYWAVSTIQSGSEYQATKKIDQLTKENGDLKTQVSTLTDQLSALQSQSANNNTSASDTTQDTGDQTNSNPTVTTTTTTTYKYQSLIDGLQKLSDKNILMKLKSSGTSVGTVQQFLNVYNSTSNKIDNDFGPAMEKAIIAFQKDQGISADGQVGPGTYDKMITWLKKQK